MTTDAEDRSTWPRNGQVIRRDELLRLIEENLGPWDLDLRGGVFLGRGAHPDPGENPIDLSPEALAPLADAYREANYGQDPPWLAANGGVDLGQAQLQEAKLSGARLQGANLRAAQLEGASLFGAHLQGAVLVAARLSRAYLMGARLQGVNLYEVKALDGAWWYGAYLDETRIGRETLGQAVGEELEVRCTGAAWHCHLAKEAYLLLKNNFSRTGRYEDASWAYVKEQQMEKMAYYREWRSGGTQFGSGWDPLWFLSRPAWGSFWRWLRNWAYELATGYGERPWNPVIGGVLIILGFAGGFCATRAIGNFWDALVYSIATFATFNLADTGPTGRAADLASSVEALLGIAVLALVVFTLGNKMSRG